MDVIFLKPHFVEKIWGGSKLESMFKFHIPSRKTGEAWVVSSRSGNESTISYPKQYKGQQFNQFYQENPNLFGNPKYEDFPLLIKIIDANQDLSVQVHPDDIYAHAQEKQAGKTESWYIISAEPDAKIIYGHNAKNKDEFIKMVENKDWHHLLKSIPVQAGEFYSVPAGTIHAIGTGLVLLETQQNSDTTYRIYDYDRQDDEGKKRELHIDKSTDVTDFDNDVELNVTFSVTQSPGGNSTHFLTNDYFSVYKWTINGEFSPNLVGPYQLATVTAGQGQLIIGQHYHRLSIGDSFIIPYGARDLIFKGNLEIIISITQ